MPAQINLSQYGITVERIFRNTAPAILYEESIRNDRDAAIASSGALMINSGAKTGRSPKDKRIVEHPISAPDIWWGDVNIKLDEHTFMVNHERAVDYLNIHDRLYVFDGYAGWEPEHQLKVRVICSRPYHALFMHNMLIRPSREDLARFLPVPTVEWDGERYYLDYDRPDAIGRVKGFYGNFGVLVRAYTYIRMHGSDGLKAVSEKAVINANYLMRRLAPLFDLPYDRHCKHEFVLSGGRYKRLGVRTLDIAKRLLDYGLHAPTIYFPLIVEEAIMIEPTETETKETLDEFVRIMETIVQEIERDPELVRTAPHETPVRRLDEARAARQPNLCWCAPVPADAPGGES